MHLPYTSISHKKMAFFNYANRARAMMAHPSLIMRVWANYDQGRVFDMPIGAHTAHMQITYDDPRCVWCAVHFPCETIRFLPFVVSIISSSSV